MDRDTMRAGGFLSFFLFGPFDRLRFQHFLCLLLFPFLCLCSFFFFFLCPHLRIPSSFVCNPTPIITLHTFRPTDRLPISISYFLSYVMSIPYSDSLYCCSSQNHDTTNDASYYNDPTFNASSISLQTCSMETEDDDDTPLALRPLRLGSESAVSVASSSSSTGARKKRKNHNSKFRVVNGDPRRRSRSGSRNRSDSESLIRSKARRSMSIARTGEEEVDLNSVDMGHHGRRGASRSRSRSSERDKDRDTIMPGMSVAAMHMAMAGSTATTTATPMTTTTDPTTTVPIENDLKEKKKGKSSIWGTKIGNSHKPTLNASASTSNLASTSFSSDAFVSTSSSTLPLASTSYATSGSSSGHNASSSVLNTNGPQQQPGWKSTTTALASSVAAKSSSLAGGVVRQSNNLVEAVRGVAKMKSGSLSKTKKGLSGLLGNSSQTTTDAEGEEEWDGIGLGRGDADSDEEFASLAQEGQKRPAVWELYTRPKTDASAVANPNASKTSLASVGGDSVARQTTGPVATTAIAPLRRQPSSGAKSVRSLGSQGSLRSRNQSTTSLGLGRSGSGKGSLVYNLKASQSTGSLLSLTRKKGHTKNSGSVTSLDSIPEVASPPPLPTGPSSYNWTTPAAQTNASSSADSGAALGSGPSPRTKKTPALPPRLSLHQADSSDLSLWSEALISGISLTGDGELGLSFGLGEEKKSKGKEKETEMERTTKPLAKAPFQPAQPPLPAPAPPPASVQPQQKKAATSNRPTAALRKAGQPLPSSKPPPSRPIPPIVTNPSSTGNSTATASRSIDHKSGSGSVSAVAANGASLKSGLGASPFSISGSNTNNINMAVVANSPAPMTGIAEAATSARFMPVTPSPFSPAVFSPAVADKPLPPLGTANDGTGVVSGRKLPSAMMTALGNGLLSPPPSAWSTSADPAFSPSGGSSAGPDSAQLWNEIEQMMDPTMISAIPGLNLGVALPPGAQGVLRSAGVLVPPPLPLPPVAENAGGTEGGVRTVGDLVGTSPVYSAAATKVEDQVGRGRQPQQQMQEDDDGDDDDESMYGDETPYGGYRTIHDINPSILPTRPADIPPVPVIVRAPSPDSRLLGVSTSREREDSDDHRDTNPNRDSSRSSTSTLNATMLPISIVRTASVARRAGAYVVDNSRLEQSRERARVASGASTVSAASVTSGASSPPAPAFVGAILGSSTFTSISTAATISPPIDSAKFPPSPSLSAYFGGGGSSEESGSSSWMSHEQPTMTDTPTTDGGLASPLTYYLDGTQTPSPTPDKVMFGGGVQKMPPKRLPVRPEYDDDLEEEEFMGYPDEDSEEAKAAIARAQAASSTPPAARPTIVISSDTVSPSLSSDAPGLSTTSTPLSPFQRYRGWLSAVVAPLEEFIDEAVDPRDHYLDLREIAEGDSGSVFAAMLNSSTAHKLRLPPLVKAKDADEILHGRTVLVAIKSVAIVPSGSPKLVDLQRELGLMRGLGLGHENVLGMDGVYVDLVEDSLWVRMELMERSLADIIGLVGDGLQLQERTIARFASDVCSLPFFRCSFCGSLTKLVLLWHYRSSVPLNTSRSIISPIGMCVPTISC